MYYDVHGNKISKSQWKEMYAAFKNRQEIIRAGLSRRDLAKMGLLTAAGYLVSKGGLSAQTILSSSRGGSGQCASPATTPFTMQLPIMPRKQPIALSSLTGPAPQINPNTTINPVTGIAFEGRTRPHQAPALGFPFPPPVVYQVSQQAGTVLMSNQLPQQTIWGFDGISPGPTYVANHVGFGMPQTSTHLHSGHIGSESDGFPTQFYPTKKDPHLLFKDFHFPNFFAGAAIGADGQPGDGVGDSGEALSTLWYHDHRVDFTAQNVYKGLAGSYCSSTN